jgi:hypothetical protein
MGHKQTGGTVLALLEYRSRSLWLFAVLALALAIPGYAQKRWADGRESEYFAQAGAEKDPARLVQVLLNWEAAFPKSEFARERSIWIVVAYERTGQATKAFARASQAFRLQPTEIEESYAVAALAPLLPQSSSDLIKITREAANNLLARASEVADAAAAMARNVADSSADETSDPVIDRVIALMREWSSGHDVRTAADVENEISRAAQTALAWAKRVSK